MPRSCSTGYLTLTVPIFSSVSPAEEYNPTNAHRANNTLIITNPIEIFAPPKINNLFEIKAARKAATKGVTTDLMKDILNLILL
jgi:hypothetical protein